MHVQSEEWLDGSRACFKSRHVEIGWPGHWAQALVEIELLLYCGPHRFRVDHAQTYYVRASGDMNSGRVRPDAAA